MCIDTGVCGAGVLAACVQSTAASNCFCQKGNRTIAAVAPTVNTSGANAVRLVLCRGMSVLHRQTSPAHTPAMHRGFLCARACAICAVAARCHGSNPARARPRRGLACTQATAAPTAAAAAAATASTGGVTGAVNTPTADDDAAASLALQETMDAAKAAFDTAGCTGFKKKKALHTAEEKAACELLKTALDTAREAFNAGVLEYYATARACATPTPCLFGHECVNGTCESPPADADANADADTTKAPAKTSAATPGPSVNTSTTAATGLPAAMESAIIKDGTHVDALEKWVISDLSAFGALKAGGGLDFERIYSMAESGDQGAAAGWHRAVDKKGPTLLVVQTDTGYVFGAVRDKGYGVGPFANNLNGHPNPQPPYDGNPFLFCLACGGPKGVGKPPHQLKVAGDKSTALYYDVRDGPQFGAGHDLAVTTMPKDNLRSYSVLGTTYACPQGTDNTQSACKNHLAGTKHFKVANFETFAIKASKATTTKAAAAAGPSWTRHRNKQCYEDHAADDASRVAAGDGGCFLRAAYANPGVTGCKQLCVDTAGCVAIEFATSPNDPTTDRCCLFAECADPDAEPAWSGGDTYVIKAADRKVIPYDEYIYAIAGDNDDGQQQYIDTVERHDGTNWQSVTKLPEERRFGAAAVLNSELYVLGGKGDGKGRTNHRASVVRMKTAADSTISWEAVAPMSIKRDGLGVVSFNGYIWAMGGHDGTQGQSSVERFDGTKWETTAGMIKPREKFGSAVYCGGRTTGDRGSTCRIYVCGGQSGNGHTKDVEYFDGSTWKAAPPMPTAREGQTAVAHGAYLCVPPFRCALNVFAFSVFPQFFFWFACLSPHAAFSLPCARWKRVIATVQLHRALRQRMLSVHRPQQHPQPPLCTANVKLCALLWPLHCSRVRVRVHRNCD